MTAAQVTELNSKLSLMRHDINNYLSLIVASVELIRYRPETAESMMETITKQPQRIGDALQKFSAEFERLLGVTGP
ncbi:MAG TPA: hypothetical protein P5205_20070 [Candidatus Paceibacterota bacterium]|nr:hypothetical protein [Verrucomicrobiota bacterium]HSA12663.1 hypothetical protein [Candidatus Paceibacterota bacterium]